ncbi:DUF6984 family protein [Roseivirga sp.]|uniref:DUF6984 family protein n=1 Tax=Roseivirga sp. TaxID=1964215 RepID=UPI003B8AA78E
MESKVNLDKQLKLIELLITTATGWSAKQNWKEGLKFERMADGGMGSLRLTPKGIASKERKFGKRIEINLSFYSKIVLPFSFVFIVACTATPFPKDIKRNGLMSGACIYTHSKEPCEEVNIEIRIHRKLFIESQVDLKGGFRLEKLPRTELIATFSKEGYLDKNITLDYSVLDTVDLQITMDLIGIEIYLLQSCGILELAKKDK